MSAFFGTAAQGPLTTRNHAYNAVRIDINGRDAERQPTIFLPLLRGHRHHVAVKISDDPDRTRDDEEDDQHAERESQDIVCAVGGAAHMKEEDKVNADLR